jgi:cytochrome c-type biogenesis protein CcmF
MIELGNLALSLALAASLYAIAASVYGALTRRRDFIASGEHAAYTTWALVLMASGIMVHALITHDFRIQYVASYSSTTLPIQYRIAALWGGMEGSMLFWALILTTLTALALFQNRARNRELMPWVNATCMTVGAFFLALLATVTPPFALLPFTPAEGTDLNPLLQNYWMSIHPPSLYLGYVSWTIPFGFAIGALATGRLDDLWIRTSRRWVLMAWFFLSLGNLFGARWAYEVLGWGGYWAWDPVENAAFLPWLTGTAYLHSVMIQERKDMLKVWNMILIIMTFSLTIFGTFLTRSGVISSVHSFTQSGLGPFFLAFLAFCIAVSVGLLIWRLEDLRPRHQLDSFVSRESAFLFNNLILLGIAFATLWGTLFPVLSEWVRGVKITVGPPFFNQVNAPLGIALLFLMGVGPLVAWRRSTVANLVKTFLAPVSFGFVSGAVAFAFGMHSLSAVLVVTFSAFVLYTIAFEFHRGATARIAMVGESYGRALLRLIEKNQPVDPGESFTVGEFTMTYNSLTDLSDDHVARLAANLDISRDGEQIGELAPEKRFYRRPEQPATEVDYRSTLSEDLYVILGSVGENQTTATFQVYVNPLVAWLWIGGIVLVLGTFVCVVPIPKRATRRATASDNVRSGERA